MNATIVAFYGIMVVTSTGGSIVFTAQGLLGGTVKPGTAVVTGGTFVSGIVALLCAAEDSLETSQDLVYGLQGSDGKAVKVIRDNLFVGNEAAYYDIEMLAIGGAAIGTYVFQAYGLESEINAAKMAGYRNN